MASLPTAFPSETYMGTLSTSVLRNVGKHCPDYLVPRESLSTKLRTQENLNPDRLAQNLAKSHRSVHPRDTANFLYFALH